MQSNLWQGRNQSRLSKSKVIFQIKRQGRKTNYLAVLKIVQTRNRRLGVVRAQRPNYYEALNVSEGASKEEIKRSFKKLALKYHPDVNSAPDAKEQFIRIKQAYEVLSDPQTRAQYDRLRRGDFDFDFGSFSGSSQRRSQTQDEEFYGLDDFFRDLGNEINQWAEQERKPANNGTGTGQSQVGSLWEELGNLGEEFVEFLETELGISKEEVVEGAQYVEKEIKKAQENAPSPEEVERKAVEDVDTMLQDLKRQMGL
eukprot:TRINITY_DN1876_c1_g1_i6.p1 TRINITY_DN1876_c1_g1~~TRINITY_DN1876_c1_g1_i6.p1  ORF type:complete len:291 (-),score=34.68 TRINITY_DN1876_c1_g1_i6:224-991(-)